MTVLVYTDLHLGTSATERVDRLVSHAAADDVEAVFLLGDVIDENRDHADSPAAGERYEQQGRLFLERLNDLDIPVVVVPGNHDPVHTMDRLIDGLANIVNAHERVVRFGDDGDFVVDSLAGGSVVGFGCEQFDLSSELSYRDFPELDVLADATPENIHHKATQQAESIEAAIGRFLTESASVEQAADSLTIDPASHGAFEEQLEDIQSTFEILAKLLDQASEPTIVLSHQPPFNTALDHHHSDRGMAGRIHKGSIPLKMAVLHAGPSLVLSGHTHFEQRDDFQTANGYTTAYNSGDAGIAEIAVQDIGGQHQFIINKLSTA